MSMPNISFISNTASIQNSMQQLNKSAQILANPNESSDITQAIIDEKVAQSSVSLNIKTIKAKDETLGTLLDLFA